MIRMSKLTDYGIVVLRHFALYADRPVHNARGVASGTSLPLPTVSKLLKALQRKGFLESHRGVKGGYVLTRKPSEIAVAEIIKALEGPIAITDCCDTTVETGGCDHETGCPVRDHWHVINVAVEKALENVYLDQMVQTKPISLTPLTTQMPLQKASAG